MGIDIQRIEEIGGGIPHVLRQDYLNTDLPLPDRAIKHIEVNSRVWHHAAKETLKKVLELLQLSEQDTLVYPWRAALAFYEVGRDKSLPSGLTHAHFGLARDEQDPETTARTYLPFSSEKLQEIGKKSGRIIIADPMLATGGSIETVIKNINPQQNIDHNRFHVACLLTAPEGVGKLQTRFPNMKIFAGVIDTGLNDQKFIVPGLGDFGDKYMASLKGDHTARGKLLNLLDLTEKRELKEIFDKLVA